MLAIVDWEMCTIGDPLLDLGGLMAGWSDPGEPPRFASYCVPREGLPTRSELAERYAERTGRDLSDLEFFTVLAIFKLACVLEGNYRLFATGKSDKDIHRRQGDIVLNLIGTAEETVRGVG
jgi:aminoglycoside phosphotransferase (APT) family kinase protein